MRTFCSHLSVAVLFCIITLSDTVIRKLLGTERADNMLANYQFAFSFAFSTTIGTLYLHDRYFLHSSALTALRPIALGTGQKSDVPRLPQAFALFRHRKRRKTETSSDASREAPERARKDTPKEVKLHKGSYPSVRLSGEVSQAFT